MEVIHDPETFRARAWSWRCEGVRLALVPTMGAFHAGHLSLMDWARSQADKVAVSLFVNPTQFGPTEDLDAYPRDLDKDAALAEAQGVDVVFAPASEAMYEPGHATWVQVPDLAEHLCGADRPTHFQGVATVVSKLFLLAMPQLAVFGQKDWQQLALIRRMAVDLGFPIQVEGRPIVREADGLAMSSRNAYLSSEERAQAVALNRALEQAADLVADGERNVETVKAALREFLSREAPLGQIDYAELVDPEAIRPADVLDGPVLAALAVRFPGARLIDNRLLSPVPVTESDSG